MQLFIQRVCAQDNYREKITAEITERDTTVVSTKNLRI